MNAEQLSNTQEIYIPKGSYSLDKITEVPQIRCGIQGPPGEGKTISSATFPNLVSLNLNRGLGALVGRSDIYDVPMFDPKFVDSLATRLDQKSPPNTRDAVRRWLEVEAPQLTKNQTLSIDSLSDLEQAFDRQQILEPVYTSSGKIDTLAFWRIKMDYFTEINLILKSLRCNVVLIAHEQLDRDQKGELNGKLKPLVAGQTADKLAKDFTDWFRMRAKDKPKPDDDIKPDDLKMFGMTKEEWKSWVNSFPRNTIYYWQTESDNLFSGKCSSMVNFPRYVPATYDSFIKYRRKSTTI